MFGSSAKPALGQTGGERITAYNVNIVVEATGAMLVTETTVSYTHLTLPTICSV